MSTDLLFESENEKVEKKFTRLKNAYNEDDDVQETQRSESTQSTEVLDTEVYLDNRKKRVFQIKSLMVGIIVTNLVFDSVLLFICITCTDQKCIDEVNTAKPFGFETRG